MPHSTLHWVHSTRIQAELYSLLLVATPFLMLQGFLQQALGEASHYQTSLLGLDIVVVPTIAVVAGIAFLIVFRSHITWLRILASVVAIGMVVIAQQFADYYFDHSYYDLQQNWHYIAYMIFAFMIYRDLSPRKGFSRGRIVLTTCFLALLFSSFDEGFQMFLSSRVFDVSDIAKDVWGTVMGLTAIYLGTESLSSIRHDLSHLHYRRIREYSDNPLSLLMLLFVSTLSLMFISSLLTEFEYWWIVALLSACSAFLVFTVFHLSQYQPFRLTVISLALALIGLQSYFFIVHYSDGITYCDHGLTVYRGVPIPFFDLMIYPDGSFRPVDKKHGFNFRDQRLLLKQGADILLIGSGHNGEGGKGFPESNTSQFIYNAFTGRGIQVIIQQNEEACKTFNRLKKEQKHVVFVLHNTC